MVPRPDSVAIVAMIEMALGRSDSSLSTRRHATLRAVTDSGCWGTLAAAAAAAAAARCCGRMLETRYAGASAGRPDVLAPSLSLTSGAAGATSGAGVLMKPS